MSTFTHPNHNPALKAVDVFRFCLVSERKAVTTTWVIEETNDGLQIGTQTLHGSFKAILSPVTRTSIRIFHPPASHRLAHSERAFILDARREVSADSSLTIAMSILFPGDHLHAFRSTPKGRPGYRIQPIPSAQRDEALEFTIAFGRNWPDTLAGAFKSLGECVALMPIRGGHFVYIFKASRPFQYRRLTGTLDTAQFPISPVGLPGLYIADAESPGVLRILQKTPDINERP